MTAGQPRKAIRSVKKTLMIPGDVCARVELELFSPSEGKLPMGAWQALLTELLLDWLSKRSSNGTSTTG